MTKIKRFRSFSNSFLATGSLLSTKQTLPIFDNGGIIYDNSSDGNKHLLNKAQLSAPKIILG